MALTQAQRVRDSRGAPEFVFNPRMGETYQEALVLKGSPSIEMDWYETKFKSTNEPYRYTVVHWRSTEARFRNHLKKIEKVEEAYPYGALNANFFSRGPPSKSVFGARDRRAVLRG